MLEIRMQTIEQRLQTAVALHQAGDLQKAERCYQEILQAVPSHPKANHNLGALYVQQQQPDNGLPFLVSALEADPAHGQYWLSYIDALCQAGKQDAARQVLALAMQSGLQGDDVHALAASLDCVARPDTERGYGVEQTNETTDVLIALFNHGRYEEAERLAQRMTERFPEHWAGWKMLGVLFNQRGESENALSPMRRAVALAPGDAESHNNLGIILQKLDRLADAENSYRQALQINPDYVHALGNLGSAQQALGRLDEAIASYKRALELAPEYVKARSNLGSAYQDIGRLEDAVSCYLRVLEIDPRYVDALYNLGIAFHVLGKQDEAEAAFQYLLGIDPNHAETQYRLGNVFFDTGRIGEAETCYRNAVHVNPGHAGAYNNLGLVLESEGQLREAEECCRKALLINPAFAPAHSNLGIVLYAQGRLDEAESSYRQALRIDPDSASVYCNLGATLQHLGRLKEAVACCRRSLRIKPDLAEAHINLGYLYCELDDLARGSVSFQSALDMDPNGYGLDAAVYLAVLSFLDGNLEQCRNMLDRSRQVAELTDAKHKHVRGYWIYLDRLSSCAPRFQAQESREPETRSLYVVGESHSLNAHGMEVRYKDQTVRCVAEWILGCKQWHLGNGTNNKYRQKFDLVMKRLPRESMVLLTIGEIDCRHDEGIMKTWRKFPEKELLEIAQSTVKRYVDYISAVRAQYGHEMIVCGVPAPNISLEALSPITVEQFVNQIRKFNAFLRECSLEAGMEFLDVYAMTDRGDGLASGQWNIDSYHLHPKAMVEAFDHFWTCEHYAAKDARS